MDSFTQLVLGAAVGQVAAGRRLGRIALAAGAIGGTIPDLDTLAISLLGPLAEWEFHRGVTHSLFFGPVLGPLLGWLTWLGYRRWRPAVPGAAPEALNAWIQLFIMALVTHPLLDLFTHYGTQLLAPFSDARFAIPAVGIIDPGYTVPLLLAVLLATARRAARMATLACAAALTVTSGYLFYAWAQNQRAEAAARQQLVGPLAEVRSYPTLFQPYLRRVVATDAEGVRIGFVSTWRPAPIAWTCLALTPQAKAALAAVRQDRAVRLLDWFAGGQLWPATRPDGPTTMLRLTDLRYGFPGATVAGWWGVDVPLDADGRPTAPGERIAVPRGASIEAVKALVAAGFGDLPALYAVTGATAPTLQVAGACAAGPEPRFG